MPCTRMLVEEDVSHVESERRMWGGRRGSPNDDSAAAASLWEGDDVVDTAAAASGGCSLLVEGVADVDDGDTVVNDPVPVPAWVEGGVVATNVGRGGGENTNFQRRYESIRNISALL